MCVKIINMEVNMETYIYMYEKDLVSNRQQCFICHKTQPNQTKSYVFDLYV